MRKGKFGLTIWSKVKSVGIYLTKWRNQCWNSGLAGCKSHIPKPIFFHLSSIPECMTWAFSFLNVCIMLDKLHLFIYLLLIRYTTHITGNQVIPLLYWVDICSLNTGKFRLFWNIKNSLCTGAYLVWELFVEWIQGTSRVLKWINSFVIREMRRS